MEVRRILVALEAGFFSSALVKCGADLAERFDAELVGFSAAMAFPALTGVDYVQTAATLYQQQCDEVSRQLEELRRQFASVVPGEIKSSWRQMNDTPDHGLITTGRSVDLILVNKQDKSTGGLYRADIGHVVMSVGRPVLVIGPETTHISADRIVIGWKDTRETRRAVVDALPFLKKASAVMVCGIEEGDFAQAKPGIEDALDWLKAHDVNAISDVVPKAVDGIGATLEKVRKDFRADLVVTGAYGHGRIQEWLLGGMTRELLEMPTGNRFMSN